MGEYAPTDAPLDATGMKVGVVAGRFNAHITERLLEGAMKELRDLGGDEPRVHWVPGAFEIPLVAKRLASCAGVDAVICCGSLGEASTLVADEKIAIARAAKEASAGRVPVMLTIAEDSTRAGARLGRAIDEALDAGVHERTGAHRTRLDRDVESGIGETVVGRGLRRRAQRDDLGMRGGIAAADRLVEAGGDQLAIAHQHRTDRHFAGRRAEPRLFERELHPLAVGIIRFDFFHADAPVVGAP